MKVFCICQGLKNVSVVGPRIDMIASGRSEKAADKDAESDNSPLKI